MAPDPVARRLLREGRAARPALAATGVLAVLAAVATIVQAALLADVVARGFLERAPVRTLVPALVGLAAAYAARAAILAGFELSGRLGAHRVMSELRVRLATRLLAGDRGAGERSGALATSAVQGVDALEGWFARSLPQLLLSAVVPPAIILFLLTRDATAALVLAATVPVLVGFMILVRLTAQQHARARQRSLGALGAHFAEVVRGLATLRAHAREDAQVASVAAVSERYRAATMATLRVAFLSAFVLELVAMLGTALVAATVGLQLVAGHLGLGAGLTVLFLAPELYAPIRALGQQYHATADGLAGAEDLLAVLDTPAPVGGGGTASAPDPATEPVVLDGVTFAHAGGPPVLCDATLRIEPGETLALVGPSGVGKSTLAALLLRLADPAAGAVRCGRTDLREVDPEAWWAQIAWVPQRPALVAGSLAENVRLARPGATGAEIHDALVQAGLEELLATLPDGIATAVGEGGRALSAGEAQRLALARAFVRDVPFVVLDEPTAHLDAATAARTGAAIAALCADRTALLIVHRPELAALADRVVTLGDGILRPAGAPRVLALAA